LFEKWPHLTTNSGPIEQHTCQYTLFPQNCPSNLEFCLHLFDRTTNSLLFGMNFFSKKCTDVPKCPPVFGTRYNLLFFYFFFKSNNGYQIQLEHFLGLEIWFLYRINTFLKKNFFSYISQGLLMCKFAKNPPVRKNPLFMSFF
jgi:hypothetical protein